MNLNIFKYKVDGIKTQKQYGDWFKVWYSKLAAWPFTSWTMTVFLWRVKSISTETTFLYKITQYLFHLKAIGVIDR